jgi:uncharacterized protein
MSERIFLDTSGWFAALNPRDKHHMSAAPVYDELLATRGTALLTTNLVVAEVHALLVRKGGAEAGVRFLDQLHGDPAHQVVWATRDLERNAVDRWLRPFRDAAFSLTDAVGFEVMRVAGLHRAFAFDRHFDVAGFERVPSV